MQQTRFIEHPGKKILLLDFSQMRDPVAILHEIGILAVATFSRRKLQAFSNRDEAKDWLLRRTSASAA